MIFNTSPDIQALILDMDGVLWRSNQPIGNLSHIFKKIRSNNLRIIFATNNSSKTIEQFQEKLRSFGVDVEPWQIVTSSIAASYLLKQKFPKGGPVFIIGEEGLINAITEQGFHHAEKKVLAVVAGIDRHITYHKLSTACLLIRQGAYFIGTNPDRTFPAPQGLMPGAGSILAYLEASSDVKPHIAGKPYPIMMEMIIERLCVTPQQILVVGDRLDTDILAGQRTGCHTALVLTGVSSRQDLENWSPKPDFIAPDLESLF